MLDFLAEKAQKCFSGRGSGELTVLPDPLPGFRVGETGEG